MRTVAIIQARVGSTRLPGKVLLDLCGKTVLGRVVERTSRMTRIKDVVVATSSLESDDAVEDECRRLGVACFRGSEDDVLDRFRGAAQALGADQCVRITADCPLIDPQVSDDIVAQFEAADPPVDYMYQTPELFTLLSVVSDVDRSDWRWTIDTPEDLAFVRSIYERFDRRSDFSWLDVVKLIEHEPALADINKHVVQKEIEQG